MNSGKVKSFRSEIGSRDRRVLSHVSRFRLSTNESLKVIYFPDLKDNAVTKITSRLVRTGWLAAHPLLTRRLYFVPGPKLISQFGLPASQRLPLGPQALATRIAIESFCAQSKPSLNLLSEPELEKHFPWMPRTIRRGFHATSESSDDGRTVLRCLRVDLGGSCDHLTRKCQRDSEARMEVHGFRELMKEQLLHSVVLTSSDAKKALIENCIRSKTWPPNTRFQIVVIEELFHLLGCN